MANQLILFDRSTLLDQRQEDVELFRIELDRDLLTQKLASRWIESEEPK